MENKNLKHTIKRLEQDLVECKQYLKNARDELTVKDGQLIVLRCSMNELSESKHSNDVPYSSPQ